MRKSKFNDHVMSTIMNKLVKTMLRQFKVYKFSVKPNILVTHDDIPDYLINPLREICNLTICHGKTRNEILECCRGKDGILWITCDNLNAEVLDISGPQLKAVSTMTSGMDYVDSKEFQRRAVILGNTPHVVNDPVADIAVGLMIAASRRFQEGRMKILNDEWEQRPQWMVGRDIVGSTIGIVGFGGIGQTILKRLQGFDIGKCLYTGHNKKPEAEKLGVQFVTFDELLKESDFIFITCPLRSDTAKIFNEKAFKKMKKTSILINVARGGIVDQPALVNALKLGEIFAVGLDVMTPEPLSKNDPLMSLPNCIIVPHLGTATIKSIEDMFNICAHNVLAGLAEGKPLHPYF